MNYKLLQKDEPENIRALKKECKDLMTKVNVLSEAGESVDYFE